MRTRVVIARSVSDEAIRFAPQHSDLGGLLRSARNDLSGASLQMRFLGGTPMSFQRPGHRGESLHATQDAPVTLESYLWSKFWAALIPLPRWVCSASATVHDRPRGGAA